MTRRIGLIVLISLLLWISFTSIQPRLYLIGWDNYSSYLGGAESLVRTFFSTWRAYRGIGVPGDSESVDIVRQGLLWTMAPFVPEPMRDQIYILLCLWLGVMATYICAERIIRRFLHGSDRMIDVAAGAAGIAHLLNLNSLATFYFPIITYITRFASLPLLLLAFDYYIHTQKVTIPVIVFFLAASFFSLGSYLTATVFFTTALLLITYAAFQGKWKRSLAALLLYIGINAFWLIPFTNYTIQKSAALRLAPIFVDTNEAQLNQSPKSYSVLKQLILYPNFFNTRYTVIDSGKFRAFHPATGFIDSSWGQLVLSILPIGAIIGILFILRRKSYRLLWIPAIYFFFVIVSSQEYSIFGFIPALLNKIPYFSVIFRFGDTKFHPYIALSGSLLFGFAVAWLAVQYWKLLIPILAVIMGILLLTVYRPYVTGDFLPNYLFVSIPQSYRYIATLVNSDPSDGRLLHLPYDPNLYWRSHDWGYMGSAWFQYLLKKPYLDKTFEPASLETTEFYRELTVIIRDANQTVGAGLKSRADRLLTLFAQSDTRWILFDSSVTPEVTSKNIRYWGIFNTTDSQTLLTYLAQAGRIEKIAEVAPLTLYRIPVAESNISTPKGFGAVVEPTVQRENNELIIRFYLLPAKTLIQTTRVPVSLVPKISEAAIQADLYRSNWHVLGGQVYSDVRLVVDGIIVPVPPITDDSEHPLGSVLVTSENPVVSLLRPQQTIPVDTTRFTLTGDPNCFGDKMEGYTYSLQGESLPVQAVLKARNGSTCIVYPLSARFAEVRLDYRASATDNPADVPGQPSSKPNVTDYLLGQHKPNQLSVCFLDTRESCLNSHQMTVLDNEGSFVIPTEFEGENLSNLRLALVPVGGQEQTFTITGGSVRTFEPVREWSMTISESVYEQKITLSFILSRGSYYSAASDGWFVSNRPCELGTGYRTTRKLPQAHISYLEGCYNELSQPLPFDSRLPKLWAASYVLFSGRYPKFLLNDPFGHYVNQYFSLYQGYPDVPGMLSLQAPQRWYRPYSYVADTIQQANPVWTSVLVRSAPELTDTREKLYTIHQDSQNEGILALYGQNITEFPSSWETMMISTNTSTVAHEDIQQQILPSLTKVTVDEGKNMVVQRVGYDRQWRAYPSVPALVFGSGGVAPNRCDGLYNCFELPDGQTTWYLFYTPERLAIVGWLVTVVTVGILLYAVRTTSRFSSI